jgi:hypothetical protein
MVVQTFTLDPLNASSEDTSLLKLHGQTFFTVTVASGFEIWISETAIHAHYWLIHKILSTENYSYPHSSTGEEIHNNDTCSWNLLSAKLWPASLSLSAPPPTHLARLKQTRCPIGRSIALPCSAQHYWVFCPIITVAISNVVSMTGLVIQVSVSNMQYSGNICGS